MGTSKSNRTVESWTGGALVFSGRRDPTWIVTPRIVERLKTLWDSLPPWKGPLPVVPTLGYRGCFIRNNQSREWLAFGGAVTLKEPDGSDSRDDKLRAFERLVISSAPDGLVPSSFVNIGAAPGKP
jgi:hypothetical protein